MNVAHLLTSTAVVTTVTYTGPADGMGDPTEVTSTASFRCWLARPPVGGGGSENTANANTQIESLVLYLEAAAADIDGFDRVAVDGITYEFLGPPWPALNPRTQVITHVESTVRRTR